MASQKVIRFYREYDDFGEFSNFFKLKKPIKYEGKFFATSEHLYQALKFIYEGAPAINTEYAEIIRTTNTPNKAFVLANQATGGGYKWRTDLNVTIKKYIDLGAQVRDDWNEVKNDIMRKVLQLKFQTDPRCKTVLLSTGNAKLIEASPRDSYWGEGSDGRGENMLGKLLMEVREELNKTEEEPKLKQSTLTIKRKAEDKLQKKESNKKSTA